MLSALGSYDGARLYTSTPIRYSLIAAAWPSIDRSTTNCKNWLRRTAVEKRGLSRIRWSCARISSRVGLATDDSLTEYKPILHQARAYVTYPYATPRCLMPGSHLAQAEVGMKIFACSIEFALA